MIVGPGHSGELPAGLPVIVAPTPYVWIIGRTQTNGVADYPAVHEVQDGYAITPLGADPEYVVDADYDVKTEPLKIVNGMPALDYFGYAAELLSANPPHPTDFSQLARIALLGIEPGKPFDASRFSAAEQAELEAGKADALAAMLASLPTLGTSVNGWTVMTDNIGVYGNCVPQACRGDDDRPRRQPARGCRLPTARTSTQTATRPPARTTTSFTSRPTSCRPCTHSGR